MQIGLMIFLKENVAQYVSHGYAGRNSGSHLDYSSGATNDSNVNNDG
jgi:hypothetical protein